MKHTFWIKAVKKDGTQEISTLNDAKYVDAVNEIHRILENDSVEYCVPIYVELKELDIEYRKR